MVYKCNRITDYLGNVRAVVREDGAVVEENDYYPYGLLFPDKPNATGIAARIQPYTTTGKELDTHYSLNWLNFGARQYMPDLGQWNRVDDLCEKYYPTGPYVYCGANPVKYIDPDGRKVRPYSKRELYLLKNTLSENDAKYVQLDKYGYIDVTLLGSHKSSSQNYNHLISMAKSELDINIYIQNDYQYRDKKGLVHSEPFTAQPITDLDFVDNGFTNVSGLTTGETGKAGITALPQNGQSGVNSTDGNINVFINSNLSFLGQLETLSHEFFGHAYIYDKMRNRGMSAHHFGFGGYEANRFLGNEIIRARKESVFHYRERHGK